MSFLKKHSISNVFVFLLLGIFALFGTMLVLLGAGTYRHAVERSTIHNDTRIVTSYLRSMVRAADAEGGVSVEGTDASPILVLHGEEDGEAYITRLYVQDGMLMESLADPDEEFDPEWGSEVCPVQSMRVELSNGLLTVHVETDDMQSTLQILLYAAGSEGRGK